MLNKEAPQSVLGTIYELADSRDLPLEAQSEDGGLYYRMRARHRMQEPETAVDRPATGAHRVTTSNPMIDGRRADSGRRRVIRAINAANTKATEISVSAIARTADVDWTFLYHHADLLGQVHAAQTSPAAADGTGPAVSRASLQADLANAQGQLTHQAARIRQLENKLSELMGEHAWRESGLDAPTDLDQLQRRITGLEQHVVYVKGQLEGREQQPEAARTETSSPPSTGGVEPEKPAI